MSSGSDVDVVVVGSGAAGLSAALSAWEHGARSVVVAVLRPPCREGGVETGLGRRINQLLVERAAVVGVAVGEDTITAGAVVVAAGGFGNNPEKLARFFPAAAETEWAWYIGAAGS